MWNRCITFCIMCVYGRRCVLACISAFETTHHHDLQATTSHWTSCMLRAIVNLLARYSMRQNLPCPNSKKTLYPHQLRRYIVFALRVTGLPLILCICSQPDRKASWNGGFSTSSTSLHTKSTNTYWLAISWLPRHLRTISGRMSCVTYTS
jgi:hypothetical protein